MKPLEALYALFEQIGKANDKKIIKSKAKFLRYLLKQPEAISDKTLERYYREQTIKNKRIFQYFLKNPIISFNTFVQYIYATNYIPSNLKKDLKCSINEYYNKYYGHYPSESTSIDIIFERCIHYILFEDIYDNYFSNHYCTTPFFKGRDNDLQNLNSKIHNKNVVIIQGIAGIGKTQFILEYAKRFKDQYQQIAYGHGNTLEDAIKSISFSDMIGYYYSRLDQIMQLFEFLPKSTLILLECNNFNKKNYDLLCHLLEYEATFIVTTRTFTFTLDTPILHLGNLSTIELHELLNDIYHAGTSEQEDLSHENNTSFSEEELDKIIQFCNYHTLLISLCGHLLKEYPQFKEEFLTKRNIYNIKRLESVRYDGKYLTIPSHIKNMLSLVQFNDTELCQLAKLSLFITTPVNTNTLNKWGFPTRYTNKYFESGLIEKNRSHESTYLYMHPFISEAIWDLHPLTPDELKPELNNFLDSLKWGTEKYTNYNTLYTIIDLIAYRVSDQIKSFNNNNQKNASKKIKEWWYKLENLLKFELESGETAKIDTILQKLYCVKDSERSVKSDNTKQTLHKLANTQQQLFFGSCILIRNMFADDAKAIQFNKNKAVLNKELFDLRWYFFSYMLETEIRTKVVKYLDAILLNEKLYIKRSKQYDDILNHLSILFMLMDNTEKSKYALSLAYYYGMRPFICNGLQEATDYQLSIFSERIEFPNEFESLVATDELRNSLMNILKSIKYNDIPPTLIMKINTRYTITYILKTFEYLNNNNPYDITKIINIIFYTNWLESYYDNKLWPILTTDDYDSAMLLASAITVDPAKALTILQNMKNHVEQLDLYKSDEANRRQNIFDNVINEISKKYIP